MIKLLRVVEFVDSYEVSTGDEIYLSRKREELEFNNLKVSLSSLVGAVEHDLPLRLRYQRPHVLIANSVGYIKSVLDVECDFIALNLDFLDGLNASLSSNFSLDGRNVYCFELEGEFKYGSIDFHKKNIEFYEVPDGLYRTFTDKPYYYSRKKSESGLWIVKAINPSGLDEVWRYDDLREYKALLSDEIKTESVRKILALVGEILWVLLDTGRIVGLDPATGECKKNIETDNVDLTHFENAETEFRSAAGYNAIFIESENKVISLYSSIYFEIDLTAEKPTRVCYNVKQTFKDSDVTGGGHQCVNSRYVFFNESMIGTLGAFDRLSKKVVWVDKLKNYKPDAGVVRELKATETQLYVHDNKQNLFVFDLT